VDEAELTGVRDNGDANIFGGGESGGPIDEEGLADKVIAGDDPLVIFCPVSFSFFNPEPGIIAGGAVVAEDEKLIVFENEGFSFGGAADLAGAIRRVGVVDIAIELDVFEGEGGSGCFDAE